jgi:hypothetical protein
MTVKELIKELEKMPQNKRIIIAATTEAREEMIKDCNYYDLKRVYRLWEDVEVKPQSYVVLSPDKKRLGYIDLFLLQ